MWKVAIVLFLSLAVYPVVGHAAETTAAPRVDAPLLAEFNALDRLVDHLTVEMGRLPAATPTAVVANATYRDLHSLALAIFSKTNRLNFEWTRELAPDANPPAGESTADDLLAVLQRSRRLLVGVGGSVGIPDAPSTGDTWETLTLDEALVALLRISRKLNGLLTEEIGPGSVYSEVSAGVKLAAELLALYPGAPHIPDKEAASYRKQPEDVHARLLGCLLLVNGIDRLIGIEPLTVESFSLGGAPTIPNDVHDIAVVVNSELKHLLILAGVPGRTVMFQYVAAKIPSQVYRRAGMLESQLQTLTSHVRREPARLGHKR
jgi:hypothetical protein